MIEAGDLEGLRKLTKTIPPKDLVEMTMTGKQTVLIFAVDKERRDIVRWLVEEKSADVNRDTRNGETPLQRAIFRNNEPIVEDLVKYGANINHRVRNSDISMTMYCIIRSQSNILDILIENGASMEYTIKQK